MTNISAIQKRVEEEVGFRIEPVDDPAWGEWKYKCVHLNDVETFAHHHAMVLWDKLIAERSDRQQLLTRIERLEKALEYVKDQIPLESLHGSFSDLETHITAILEGEGK